MILVTTRFGTYWINANWLRNKAAHKKAYTRVRRVPNQT